MKKLLIISGPTSTGKTKLALHLAKVFSGELISADSRQVYKQMDIGTGKEYSTDIPIWGYDLVFPNEDWSAAHFVKFARRIISEIYQRKKLPIIVGGTGLYIKNLLHPPETLFISPDQKLRQQLEKLSLTQLQNKLRRLNSNRFDQMNQSDRQNPRRLIRAIEVMKFACPAGRRAKLPKTNKGFANFNFDTLHLGLTLPDNQQLYRRIDRRVEDRLGEKLNQELKFLKQKDFLRFSPSQTIGYHQLIEYLDGKITFDQAVQKWKFAEHKYARNQLTWFKKQPGIRWFDITAANFPVNVVMLIRKWYYK